MRRKTTSTGSRPPKVFKQTSCRGQSNRRLRRVCRWKHSSTRSSSPRWLRRAARGSRSCGTSTRPCARRSGGRLGFKLYPGGVAGDEKDVIRKIRLGQYGGGGFTGIGIGEVAKKVRILDAPLFFQSYDEVEYIVQKYEKDFDQALEDGGFVLLGWAEVGFIYVFSSKQVTSLRRPEVAEGLDVGRGSHRAGCLPGHRGFPRSAVDHRRDDLPADRA